MYQCIIQEDKISGKQEWGRKKSGAWKVGEHMQVVCYKLATASQENPAGSVMWEVFREATHWSSFYVLSHSLKSTPQSFIFPYTQGSYWGSPLAQQGYSWALELLQLQAW